MFKAFASATVVAAALLSAVTANAADRVMTSAELKALFSVVQVIKLGGPSSGYYGALVLSGTPSAGSAKGIVSISGGWKAFEGTWKVQNDKFCRVWDTVDPGKQVCEVWKFQTDTSVAVFVGGAEMGVNSW